MSGFELIFAKEASSVYEVREKQGSIEKKFQDDRLQINAFRLSAGRMMYLAPLDVPDAFKSFYVVKGKCLLLESGQELCAGDMIVVRALDEVKGLQAIEDVEILVHASSVDVYGTLRDQQDRMKLLIDEIQRKDQYTGEHSNGVYELTKALAIDLGYSNEALYRVSLAAYYHDLGKVYIDDAILNKPSALTAEEYVEIQKHVSLGRRLILEHLDERVFYIIEQHHERLDGSGYPYGLKGDEIMPEARLIAVCDSFDAMTTDRVYKKAMSIPEALKELRALAGTKYDEQIVKALEGRFL